MLVILLLAISSAIDHHLLEEAYNPFGYALFAGVEGMKIGKECFFGGDNQIKDLGRAFKIEEDGINCEIR